MPSRFVVAGIALAVLAGGCDSGHDGASAFGKGVSAERIALRLKAAGMPIGQMQVYDASTDPNKLLGRLGQYTSKVNFLDKRLGGSQGASLGEINIGQEGSVEVFANEEEARKRTEYMRSITERSALVTEYGYLRGLVYLRLPRGLTPEQAKQYERALRRL